MKNLKIELVPDSPYYPAVDFNVETGVCQISGESYMEEAYKFYLPLIDWIRSYTTDERRPIIMNFKLSYFNTSSSRLILDIMDMLKKYQESGGDVQICWFYDTNDPDAKDEVEDFEMESGLKIDLKPLE